VTARYPRWLGTLALALVLGPLSATASAQTTPKLELPANLQAPQARSTRNSAYVLPPNVVGLEAGLMGLSADDLYGRIGIAMGFKHGLQVDMNLLHWGVALFNVNMRWNFLELRRFALAADVGFTYAHGDWVWILGWVGQKLASDANLYGVPVSVTASAPLSRWLQLDLAIQYRHSDVQGHLGQGQTFYADTEIGARQLLLRPSARFFASSRVALEVSARLPLYQRVPVGIEGTAGVNGERDVSRNTYADVQFSSSWMIEAGIRSCLRSWLYATLRIQYGQLTDEVYGAPLFPAFSLEFRL
jgi:hypothetical protein